MLFLSKSVYSFTRHCFDISHSVTLKATYCQPFRIYVFIYIHCSTVRISVELFADLFLTFTDWKSILARFKIPYWFECICFVILLKIAFKFLNSLFANFSRFSELIHFYHLVYWNSKSYTNFRDSILWRYQSCLYFPTGECAVSDECVWIY